MEVHRPEEEYSKTDRENLWREVSKAVEQFRSKMPGVEVQRMAIELAVDQADGLPRMIGERVTRVANESADPLRNTPDEEKGRGQRLWF